MFGVDQDVTLERIKISILVLIAIYALCMKIIFLS